MDTKQRALRQQLHALWATIACFILGVAAALRVLRGTTRPFAGEGSLIVPMALIAAVLAALAFLLSSYVHRRGETQLMPPWQKLISHVSFFAVTIAFGGVTGLGVLLAGQLMGAGLPGLQLGAIGGSLITGVVSALAGRLAFQAGIDLGTRDLATLLFTFLIVGTVYAMISQADPTWWERDFSQLGIGDGAWVFNGTMIVAGLLIATIGSYVGRDLHRWLKDDAVNHIAKVVAAWALAGIALAGVGWFPIDQQPLAHAISAFAALLLIIVAAWISHTALPRAPLVLVIVTAILVVLVVGAVLLTFWLQMLSVTALESIVVGLSLLWMTTYVRVLSILAPNQSIASTRWRLLADRKSRRRHHQQPEDSPVGP